MPLVLLPAAQANNGVDAMFPSASRGRTATATNGTTTLTFPDVAGLIVGMSVTGTGITSGGVITGITGNVVTITGTITTLTTSAYTFTLSAVAALYTGSPGTTGASNEVSGGSYTRQPVSYGSPALGVEVSTNAQSWTGMPACTVTDFGNFANSTYLGGGPLVSGGSPTSLTVPANSTVAAAIGALSVQVTG